MLNGFLKAQLKLVCLLILVFQFTNSFGQRQKDILGSWVRVASGESLSLETAFQSTDDEKYLKLQFDKDGRLKIYGSYKASGISTDYKFKRGKLTYGFDRAFTIDTYSDSTLVLLEEGSAARHYYLREIDFLKRIPVLETDWYSNGEDKIYFASKKLYPQFITERYPDFHLYVHNAAKSLYNLGPNYMFASFTIQPNGNITDIELWHHVNEQADTKVIEAIENSSHRWKMPFLDGKRVAIHMYVDDSYVKRDTREGLGMVLSQNEVFEHSADVYRNSVLRISQYFKLQDYESALEYIGICEKIEPEEPNLLYLKYRAYVAMNNEVESSKLLELIKSSQLSYLVD